MTRKQILIGASLLAIGVLNVANCHASIQVAIAGNDKEVLDYLADVLNVDVGTFIAKDEDNGEGVDEGPLANGDWSFDGGGNRSGTWTITNNPTLVPGYWWVKFGTLSALYTYMGPDQPADPTDSYDLDADFWDPATEKLLVPIVDSAGKELHAVGDTPENNGKYKTGNKQYNPAAGTSHVRIQGSEGDDGVIPEPTTLAVWSLLSMLGFASAGRRRC